MPSLDLDPVQIQALIGTRHATTGITFPPAGLVPYHHWLIQTLHRLAEASFGALRCQPDDQDPASVGIAPGRASIGAAVLELEPTTLDLATFNNDTALVALTVDTGTSGPLVTATRGADGWPGGPHLKLAEVTLAGGQVQQVVDRRLDAVFRA